MVTDLSFLVWSDPDFEGLCQVYPICFLCHVPLSPELHSQPLQGLGAVVDQAERIKQGAGFRAYGILLKFRAHGTLNQ